jgi:serine/threonine-protein kinase
LDEKAALQVGLEMAQALDFMQSQGLVHRDIKPGNIIMGAAGSKLMDLGLARTAGQDAMQLTAPGTAIGTPIYMSTEQLKGQRDLDIRTDIYSLGATLFYALTGHKPFEGEKPSEIIKKKLEGNVPNVKARRRNLSDEVDVLVMTMMSKNRDERHATPTELAGDVQRVLRGEAPERLPVSGPRKSSLTTIMTRRPEWPPPISATQKVTRRQVAKKPRFLRRALGSLLGLAVAAAAVGVVLKLQGVDPVALVRRWLGQ